MKDETNPQVSSAKHGSVLVLGGGIAGIQSALDLADAGFKVYLVEKQPSIGGTMPQLDKTFPTNDCAMCILAPKLVATGRHPNIELITYSDLKKIKGESGNFTVTINKKARFVDESLCNGCGLCVENCLVRYKPQKPIKHDVKKGIAKHDLAIVDDIVKTYGKTPDSLIPVMQAINERYNHLPKNILQYVATELEVPLSQAYHVATFYTSFTLKPRGKHIIKVCMGTACHVRGSPRVLDEVQRHLKIEPGETTDDGMFTLETVNCLGACAIGPVVVIDEKYYMVKPGDFDKVLKEIISEKISAVTAEVKS
jgi:NADH:ubiquinone oxidoreductase subunit E